ncbi:MAG: alpha/beta fold hydrolase [Paracoccaceae bacterium]|nr:alpha/beta fold hydrolase [Paracoccaceae bacterium]
MGRWFLIIVLLTACAPRQVLVPMPEGTIPYKTISLFTATNRGGEGGRPVNTRSERSTFASIDVAVPVNRTKGQIVTPVGRAADPTRDFLLARAQPLGGEAGFSRALRAELRSRPPAGRDVLIYVHGFNNTFSEGVLRMAQLTHDLDLGATSVHFAWPSAANPLGYERDRGSALFSRDALENVIRLTKEAGARRIILVAHSMGGFLAMETLRQMAIANPGSVSRDVHGVVLISPDIDVDVFRAQARRIGKLPAIFAIFVADQDRALQLSARLTGEKARLGNLQDPRLIQDLKVTLIDVSQFADNRGAAHFIPGTAPELIEILSSAAEVDGAFNADNAGRTGLLPGSVLTIQNVTELVLTPLR